MAPASLPSVITVAASNLPSKFQPAGDAAGAASDGAAGSRPAGPETMYRWSNTGPCVDIFAPGVEIWSACGGPGAWAGALVPMPSSCS